MNLSPIATFLSVVRARLNRAAAACIAARCLLGAAATAVMWAIGWRAFGYAAPFGGYAVITALALLAYAICRIVARHSVVEAAAAADTAFALKDGLVSWLGFDHRDGEVYRLQEAAMEARLADHLPEDVPVAGPGKIRAMAHALTVVAVTLAVLPHSDAVLARLAREEQARARSAEVKRQVEEAVEELIADLDKAERALLDPAKLRELAAQLEQTADQRDAEKQVARFEQELSRAMQGLEARQDEAVLKLAADELANSAMAEMRQLGKKLGAKDFEKAREAIEAMKPVAKPELTPEELKELRKNAAHAREMAKRMADGARQRSFGKATPGDHADAAMPMAEGNQQAMQDLLEDLDAAGRQLGQKLEQGEFDPDAEARVGAMAGEMDELGKRLGQLAARGKAREKLNALRQGLGEARQFAQGRTQALGLARAMAQSNQPGGQGIGTGSAESRREQRDAPANNENLAQIKGQANPNGASSNTVESAESGGGIAGRAAVDRQREFRQQLESLVRRDDIPEELKLGVREYFERIHETAE